MQDSENVNDQTIFRQTDAQFLLRGVSGITFGRNFTLVGNMIVGRLHTCDVTIPISEISRKHARIVTRPGSILLEDLGSANGTFVDGEPIDKAIVFVGSEIRFDKIRFQLQSLNQVEELLTEPNSQKRKPPAQQATEPGSSKKTIIIGLLVLGVCAGLAYYFLRDFI